MGEKAAEAEPTEVLNREAILAWRAFLEAHAGLVEALERELLEELGLPLTFFDVLVHLGEAPEGRLRMQELAERVLLSRSGFTRLCDRMEAAGLLERARCPSDRRGIFASITPAGREALRAAVPVHMRGVEEHFARRLGAGDVAALRTMLDRVCEGNRDTRARACGPVEERQSPGDEE